MWDRTTTGYRIAWVAFAIESAGQSARAGQWVFVEAHIFIATLHLPSADPTRPGTGRCASRIARRCHAQRLDQGSRVLSQMRGAAGVAEADLDALPDDLGGAAGGDPPLHPGWSPVEGGAWSGDAGAVQSRSLVGREGQRQGADHGAVDDHVRELGFQRQGDAAAGSRRAIGTAALRRRATSSDARSRRAAAVRHGLRRRSICRRRRSGVGRCLPRRSTGLGRVRPRWRRVRGRRWRSRHRARGTARTCRAWALRRGG